jgi:hypothetical protein
MMKIGLLNYKVTQINSDKSMSIDKFDKIHIDLQKYY